MCFKYEALYDVCFDLPFMYQNRMMPPENMNEVMEYLFNAKISDPKKFAEMRYEIFEIFERMHEQGVIRPMTRVEKGKLRQHVYDMFDKIEEENQELQELGIVGVAAADEEE